MKSSVLALILVMILAMIDTSNCQFYVDIEHSLPRIGKRGEGELMNTQQLLNNYKEILNSRKAVKQQQADEGVDEYERELAQSAARTFQLIRILNRSRQDINNK